MLSEIADYKYKLRISLNALGFLASAFFSALQMQRGDFGTGAVSLFGAVYFLLIVVVLVRKRHYLWRGRGFLLFLPITILNVIYLHPEFGIFWAYVGIVSIFMVMDFKEATAGVVVFLLCVFLLAFPQYPEPVLYRIYASLLLVTLFTFIFSYLIERLHRQLAQLATEDPLTKLFNRHAFNYAIQRRLHEKERYKVPVSMILFDLDNFKTINDTYGHQEGDRVLQRMAQLIKKRLRTSDQFFRYGGEEFAILLAHSQLKEAVAVAKALRQAVHQYDFGIGRPVSISAGVSEACHEDKTDTWIERCDKALYHAKHLGRNRVVSASYQVDHSEPELKLESNLESVASRE